MRVVSQQNLFLKFLEEFFRSNLYLFIFFRFITSFFFSKIIFDTDFNFLNYISKNKLLKNKILLDVGGCDGMSIKIMRKFTKNKIYSFEPIYESFMKLKKLEKKNSKLRAFNFGLSNKNKTMFMYKLFFKEFHLSPYDSLYKKDIFLRIKKSLFVKNIKKKIHFKREKILLRKLDNLKLNPCFIKVDIEGHEYKFVQGALQTIKKYTPIIMMEYEKKNCEKVFSLLKKNYYQKYFWNDKKKKLIKHKCENVFNIFFITNNKYVCINDNRKIIN